MLWFSVVDPLSHLPACPGFPDVFFIHRAVVSASSSSLNLFYLLAALSHSLSCCDANRIKKPLRAEKVHSSSAEAIVPLMKPQQQEQEAVDTCTHSQITFKMAPLYIYVGTCFLCGGQWTTWELVLPAVSWEPNSGHQAWKALPLPTEPARWPSPFYMVQDYCPKNGSTHSGKTYLSLSWDQNNFSQVTIDVVKLTASQVCLVSRLAYAHPSNTCLLEADLF